MLDAHDRAVATRSMTDATGKPASETTIDLRGLKCPLPALRARKALSRLPVGAMLVVECTDPLAEIDIPNLVRETGDHLEHKTRRDDVLVFRIRKREGS
jgi:tRNA 2-thiouridine synthesizing protein A